jgi:hypothetical protein
MKNLDLNACGVVEMEIHDYWNVNGGGFDLALALIGAAIYVYNNWGDFVEGFNSI